MKTKERKRGVPSPCKTCHRDYSPLRGGECVTCYRFRNRTGSPRPYGARNGTKEGVPSGDKSTHWRGDEARPETKRRRAQKAFKLGKCESCPKPATDRHHKDGNTGNNNPDNIKILCRRCHMKEDGRLDKFLSTCRGLNGRQITREQASEEMERLLAYECKTI